MGATGVSLYVAPSGKFGTAPTSSIRYKENFADLDIGIEDIMKVHPVYFDFKESYAPGVPRQMDLIAEELAEISPLLVEYRDGQVDAIAYHMLLPVLIKAIQDLKRENDQLREDIEILKELIR